jgi:hypothetical protein
MLRPDAASLRTAQVLHTVHWLDLAALARLGCDTCDHLETFAALSSDLYGQSPPGKRWRLATSTVVFECRSVSQFAAAKLCGVKWLLHAKPTESTTDFLLVGLCRQIPDSSIVVQGRPDSYRMHKWSTSALQ